MKKLILSIITVLTIVLTISNSTYAAAKNDAAFTVLSDVNKINKIEIYGNVQLYVSDGSADQVKVYNKYYSESALVQNTNGVLRITSYKNEKLVIWVTANDLRSISAFDNAEVKSFGQLSKIDFAVELHDNATAKLNLDAYNVDLKLSGVAKATLSGHATEFSVDNSLSSNVINNNFTATHINENKFSFSDEVATSDRMGL